MKLSAKHERFVSEYLVDGNGLRAAIAAGYSSNGAGVAAHRLLSNVNVASEIANRSQKIANKLEISAEKTLQGIAELAFFDIRKLFAEDGSLKQMHELDPSEANAIAGIEVNDLYEHFGKGKSEKIGIIRKVKLADRGVNLERLGRHLKLFTDKIEVAVSEGVVDRLMSARKRVASK